MVSFYIFKIGNASLNIQCSHTVNSIETATAIPTFIGSAEGTRAYSTTQSFRNTTMIQQQNDSEDVKLYYSEC